MSKCDKVKLSELIIQKTDIEQIVDMENEHYITLSLYGKGARERVIKDGKYPVPFTGYRVSEGQFIYSRIDARNGAYAIIGPELDGFVVSKDFPVFDINESKVLPHFLRRAVLSDAFINQVKNSSFGATNRMRIKEDIFADYSIPLPELSKQKEIVDILDRVETIINSRQQELQKLDDLIKARFIEMFGSPESDEKYPQIAIKDFTEVISGGTPDRKNNEYWENGIVPWVKTTELQNNHINVVEEYITEKGLNESSAKVVPKNTVLIAMYGQGKTRGMTAILGIPASTNQACACILPCEKVKPKYLWQYMIMSYDRLRNLAQGGNQPNLNGNMIKNFTVLVPPRELQLQYVQFVEQVNKSKLLEARQAGFIAKYRPINIILSIG